jgi:hypothetical protein
MSRRDGFGDMDEVEGTWYRLVMDGGEGEGGVSILK